MARKTKTGGKKTGKRRITAKQKAARRKNMAIARRARKKGGGKKKMGAYEALKAYKKLGISDKVAMDAVRAFHM
jgi:hypothetical protein